MQTHRRHRTDQEELQIGESDELGYIPKTRPVTPAEMAATIYKALGLDPHKELPGPQGRPIPLAEFSVKPVGELF